jgi:FkbM family methyltransferase
MDVNIVKNGVSFTVPPTNNHIQDWMRNHYEKWEEDTFALINRYVSKDKLLFDIGSWVGLISIPYSYRFSSVIAVEADKESVINFRQILDKNNITNVEIVERAVYSSSEETLFFGTNKVRNDGHNQSTSQLKQSASHSTDYQVKTIGLLDLILPRVDNVAIVKIDIEGGEEYLLNDIITLVHTHKIPTLVSFHFGWFSDKSSLVKFSNEVQLKNIKTFNIDHNELKSSVFDYINSNNFECVLFTPAVLLK